jgi:hypothetical protein
MSTAKLTIDRVGISLFGVSQEIAEAAVSGLEGELARRIGALPLRAAAHAPVDLAEVALGPITAPARVDAGALRSLIADALVAQVLDAYAGSTQQSAATPEAS